MRSTSDRHRRRTRGLAALVAAGTGLGLAVVGAPDADAYAFNGCRWNHTGVRLYVPAPLVSAPVWNSAQASWRGLDAGFVWNGSPADVTGTNESRGNTVAWTGVTRQKGTVQSAPSCPNGFFASGQVEVVLNWSVVSGYSASKRQGVAAHELGHALGLAHTTSSQGVLMYPYDSRTVYTPQGDDKAGVNARY